MEEYIKLLDCINQDTVIKVEDRKQYIYVFGKDERWVRTGIMLEYYNERDEKYDKYVEISKNEAEEIINAQRIMYNQLYQYIKAMEKEENICRRCLWNYVVNEGGFGNIKTDIVALIYSMEDKEIHNKEIMKRTPPGIAHSLEVLFQNISMFNEQQLVQLRRDTSTHQIIFFLLKEKYENKQIGRKKYKILLDYFGNKIIYLDEKQKRIMFEK